MSILIKFYYIINVDILNVLKEQQNIQYFYLSSYNVCAFLPNVFRLLFSGVKKKNPEPQLFSGVGDWLRGWTHSRGYLKKKILKKPLIDFP